MAKLNIKKGDNVLVIAGKENGKVAEVLECFPDENKVTVKGLNIIVKHNKPRSAQDKGGIVKKEGKIDASDVMVVCPACNKATKIKYAFNDKNEKVRMCKKCGKALDSGVKKPTQKKETKSAEKPAETVKATVKDTQKHETKTAVKTTKSATTVKKSPSTAKKIGGK